MGRGVVGADVTGVPETVCLPRFGMGGIMMGGAKGGIPTAEGGGVGIVARPSFLSETGVCMVDSSLGTGSSFILMTMS